MLLTRDARLWRRFRTLLPGVAAVTFVAAGSGCGSNPSHARNPETEPAAYASRPRDFSELKNRISRDIMAEFDKAGIGIASGTYEIVGVPPISVQMKQDGPGRG